jgi:hypothetical protein
MAKTYTYSQNPEATWFSFHRPFFSKGTRELSGGGSGQVLKQSSKETFP